MTKEQEGKLKDLRATLDKEFGKNSVKPLSDESVVDIPKISTGDLGIDLAGGGGYPKGRIIEIYGPESSGKTTLTLHAIAEAQKTGKPCAFIDAEHALDPVYAENLGVNMDDLWITQPNSGEEGLNITQRLVESGEFSLIVVDSVPALTPQAEMDGEMGDQQMGAQARMMGKGIRKLTSIIGRTNTVVIFINQIRMKIGVMFGNPETTPGGRALPFAASQRIEIRRKEDIKIGTEIIGVLSRVKFKKNKVGPPFKETYVEIEFGKGINSTSTLIDLAVREGLLEKAGAWYKLDGENIGQGKAKTKIYLEDNPKVLAELDSQLRSKFFGASKKRKSRKTTKEEVVTPDVDLIE